MIKSILLIIFIFALGFTVTCGGILIGFASRDIHSLLGLLTLIMIIVVLPTIGIIVLLRKVLKVYIWRYLALNLFFIGVSTVILGLFIGILLWIIPAFYQLIVYLFQFLYNPYLYKNPHYVVPEWGYMIITTIYIALLTIHTTYFFHFYRTKAIHNQDLEGSFIGDLRFTYHQLIALISRLIKRRSISQSAKIDLMSSLSRTDISNIDSITFLPRDQIGFTIKTPNIKRLAVYIINKLGKNTFEGEELRKAFDYVVKNISSDLSKRDFDLITGKIEEFVKSGGEVKINTI